MSLTFASPIHARLNVSPLERAIIETLAYSDIFDQPLTLDELHCYLVAPASRDEINECVINMKEIACKEGYYFLADHPEIVDIRKQREENSRKVFERAMFYGRILGRLPFIRMAALTGSLAVLNLSKNIDMDFMLVAKPGRVWIARAFAIVLGKIARLFGDTICPNIIVSESALAWHLHDLYSARELTQMIPITGLEMYHRLRGANLWVEAFLPNAYPGTSKIIKTPEVWRLGELPLCGRFGDKIESWEMNRKIARFSKQAGFGAETVFTPDVCQGNFHQHRIWTHREYQERLSLLGFPLPSGEGRRRTEPVEVVRAE